MHSYRTRLEGLLGLLLILGLASCSGGSTGGTSTGSKAKASGSAGSSGHGGSSGSSGNGSTSTGTGKKAGSAGAGSGGSSGSAAACDASGFVADCMQGGAQWGTEQHLGPCSSGITTYGVHTQYGPYGVRSDYNVGMGFENAGTDDSAFCNGVFIPSFGADPKGSMDLEMTHDLKFNLYTVYYPGCMPDGEQFPLITWGNGTCAMPEGYGPLLRYVASFGYIVIAANNREVGSGAPMSKGLDFMLAQNDDASSKFYQHIDKDNIGAMGHSQGGGATVMVAANDARVKSVIIFSGGSSASKPYFAFSGDHDLGSGTDPSALKNAVMASQQPAAWMWFHQVPQAVNGSTTGGLAPGHLTTMMESERVVEETVAWWDMELKGKADAKSMFIGDACTLCDTSTFGSTWPPYVGLDMPAHEYGHNTNLN